MSTDSLFERHRGTLDRALTAIRERGFWSAYPESLKAYGDPAGGLSAADGKKAFEAYLGKPFDLPAGADGGVGAEASPYGFELGITYPRGDIDATLRASEQAMPQWRDAGPEVRTGICMEILARLNARSHEMAQAVMHTSGQGYAMAFQAGGPHAQDRALEAIAYTYDAMTHHVRETTWEKPQGKRPPQRLTKRFTVVPRGVALVIGCNTFPTWNSYPGLFASLAAGNPVLVKPHPQAVLPLAITVAVARYVLTESGHSPDLVTLFAEEPGENLAKILALRPEVRIIDYTGSTEFGLWLERTAHHAVVFTEKSGVNSVVVDSTDNYQGLLANLAFSLSLYSGQMCTTPQNILVPRSGITADGEVKPLKDLGDDLAEAVEALLGDDARATGILGAIVNAGVLERIADAPAYGDVVLPSRDIVSAEFPHAKIRTPTIVQVDASERDTYVRECFGPVSFLIATESTAESIAIFRETARDRGAITALVHSTDASVVEAMEQAALETGVALSCNLTDGVYVNQSAAFSDFHATGANPAANATLTDPAYVASRFRIVQVRSPLPDEVSA